MTRRTFFSFQYKGDVSRAMIVRKSWVTQGKEAAGFIDAADFEEVKKKGKEAVEDWIDGQLKGTSVTVVLVGADTCRSEYVQYEINKSIEIGNGLLEIDVSQIKDLNQNTSTMCGRMVPSRYKHYSWKSDDGYNNMGDWIETAAKNADR